MHHLLATRRSAGLVRGDGAGRYERFTLTAVGEARLVGASTAAAAVEERMIAGFSPEQRRRLLSNLATCADALD